MNGKLTLRSAIALAFAALAMSACLFGCGQSATSSSSSASGTASAEGVVTVEIDPSAAEGLVDLPADDLAIITDTLILTDDLTAYDALVTTGAAIEGEPSYVTSINGLAEKAAGPTYGWMYEVNGEAPTVAANEYLVEADDVVRWYYASWEEQ